MRGTCRAWYTALVLFFLITGVVTSDVVSNESVNDVDNMTPVKAGDATLIHMIQMATGPILSGETDEGFEGSWAFNFGGDSYGGWEDPYDSGWEDPYDIGIPDPIDVGDPFDTGYDPINSGIDTIDPYNTGFPGGMDIPGSYPPSMVPPGSQTGYPGTWVQNPITSPGNMFPPGSQIMNPGAVSSSGSKPGSAAEMIIDQIGKMFKQYKVKPRTPPVKNPPAPPFPQPNGFDCVLGSCDCTGYQIYCQPNYHISHEDGAMWKARCCGDYSNPFGRY